MDTADSATKSDYLSISERFIAFENEHDLISRQLAGVHYWPLIRQRIYTKLLMHAGLIDEPHHTVPTSARQRLRTVLSYLSTAVKNLFRPWPQVDCLIVNHPRKARVDGEYQDLYSQWLTEHLEQQQLRHLVLDVPLNWGQHLIAPSATVRFIENFGFLRKITGDVLLRQRPRAASLDQLEAELCRRFGTGADAAAEARRRIRHFKIDYKFFSKVLRKTQPKRVFYVVKNNHHPLIAACNRLGVTVEEIQHGIIHPYHLMYRYDQAPPVPYFPDRFCLFGSFWAKACPMPLAATQFDYYAAGITSCDNPDRDPATLRRILFLSQPTIGKQLVDFLADVLKQEAAAGYEWCYKLHPSEFANWQTEYPRLLALSQAGAVRVVDSFDEPLFDLFKAYGLVVGVQSTAVFEALYFKCRVYIAELPSSEILSSMFADQENLVISSPQDFFASISRGNAADQILPDDLFTADVVLDLSL